VPPLIAAQGLSKRFGVSPLFQNLSFTVSEGERIGLVGPNGSGKSTLLEMLFGRVQPDTGDVAIRKRTRVSFVAQMSTYAPGLTIRKVLEQGFRTPDLARNNPQGFKVLSTTEMGAKVRETVKALLVSA